jgi:acetyl esterase/lipase
LKLQVVANAIKYNVDVHRIGLWGASAGGNLAAALAIRHVERQRQESLPDLCYVSLVVPVTAHPQAFETFEKERDFPKSESELLFTNAPPAPPPVVEEFEKLLGKWQLHVNGV